MNFTLSELFDIGFFVGLGWALSRLTAFVFTTVVEALLGGSNDGKNNQQTRYS